MLEYLKIGSIRNIIFQTGQFNCATDNIRGQYNAQNIYNIQPEEIHFQIADWAISGNRINEVGLSLWFMNPYRPVCPGEFPYNGTGEFNTKINLHCFYDPTPLYYET